MPSPYAADLRRRVVAVALDGGQLREAVAVRFAVGRSTVYRWVEAAQSEGRLEAMLVGRRMLNRAGIPGGSEFCKDGAMGTKKPSKPYPAELRERAVRLVREQEAEHASQASAIRSIAEKVGCNAETLRLWVRQPERDRGQRADLTTDEPERLKALEREVRERRQASEILREASGEIA